MRSLLGALGSVLLAGAWLACGARSALDLPVERVAAGDAADGASDIDADAAADASSDAASPRDAGADGAPPPDASPPDAAIVACSVGCTPPLPAAPRPLAPLSTARVSSHTPLLRWALAPGSDGARVEICRDRACAAPVASFLAAGSSATPPRALAPGVYFWRVRGTAGNVEGTAASPIWELFVGGRDAPVQTSWTNALDVDGDGFADVVATIDDGRVLVYLGGSGPLTAAPVTLMVTQPSLVAVAGDVNGDGFGDFVVAGPGGGSYPWGSAYLYLGGPGFRTSPPAAIPNPTPGLANQSEFAYSLAGAGDVNGDGYADVLIGDPNYGYPGGGTVEPAVYLYYGGPNGLSSPVALKRPAYGYGSAVAGVGDVNGDGYADIAVDGNPGLYLFLGGPNGPGTPATYATLSGGTSLAGATDVNGDGYADVVVGEPNADIQANNRYEGAMQVYLGTPSGIATSAITLHPPATGAGEGFGWAATGAGDTNGDGFDEIAVSANMGPNSGGVTYVFFGAAAGVSPSPVQLQYAAGWSLGGGGDFDGDGYADIVSVYYRYTLDFYLGGPHGPSIMAAAEKSLYGVYATAL